MISLTFKVQVENFSKCKFTTNDKEGIRVCTADTIIVITYGVETFKLRFSSLYHKMRTQKSGYSDNEKQSQRSLSVLYGREQKFTPY